ncbi:hypothetical protein SDC9_169269 [bioreactor metagenome]|uniref:Uncharacterized protein n=1 Tax=bioreactor metagenome TaxID=1076179 RepID=A0A645G4Q9_9ZZZZ
MVVHAQMQGARRQLPEPPCRRIRRFQPRRLGQGIIEFRQPGVVQLQRYGHPGDEKLKISCSDPAQRVEKTAPSAARMDGVDITGDADAGTNPAVVKVFAVVDFHRNARLGAGQIEG